MGNGLNGYEKVMTPVGVNGTKVLEQMAKGLSEPGTGHQWKSKVYMPLSIDLYWRHEYGDEFTVCQYGDQNGDLMNDPLVHLIRTPDGKWYPTEFRNDYAGYWEEHVRFANGSLVKLDRLGQKDLVEFCDGWLRALKQQYGDQFVEAGQATSA